MGPQLVRCGMPSGFRRAGVIPLRFNGAATCSLRNEASVPTWAKQLSMRFNGAATCSLRNVNMTTISKRPDAGLQWGRNLFVAECVTANGTSYRRASFNGAATCSLRNVVPISPPADVTVASMGPQLVRCGMVGLEGYDARLMVASMGPQLVRCGMFNLLRVKCLRNQCFNGAATCSLRNVNLGCMSCLHLTSASMGPQLVRCGM